MAHGRRYSSPMMRNTYGSIRRFHQDIGIRNPSMTEEYLSLVTAALKRFMYFIVVSMDYFCKNLFLNG